MRGNRKGFTVMEMLIVVALFAMLGVVIVNVYLLSLSAQRQTVSRQNTTANLRYVVESIARQIRTGEVDYTATYLDDGAMGIQGSEKELFLKDSEGNSFAYFVQGGELLVSYNGQVSKLTNISEVKVIDLAFYIDPPTDPFFEERCNDGLALTGCLATAPTKPVCTINDATTNERLGFCQCTSDIQCASQHCDASSGVCLPLNRQPRVTIVISFEATAVREIEVKRLYLQTTIASRTYQR